MCLHCLALITRTDLRCVISLKGPPPTERLTHSPQFSIPPDRFRRPTEFVHDIHQFIRDRIGHLSGKAGAFEALTNTHYIKRPDVEGEASRERGKNQKCGTTCNEQVLQNIS